MKLPRRGSLVLVVWDDSASNSVWTRPGNGPSVARVVTSGYLVVKMKRELGLAATHAHGVSNSFGDQVAIPRGAVRKVFRLRQGKRVR